MVQTLGIPADQVLAQSPTANATQVVAPKISLLVTTAAEPQAFVMPSLVGQALGSASRTLQDAGFRLGNVSVAEPVSLPPGDTGNPTAPGAPPANAIPAVSAVPSPAAAPPAQVSPASIIVSQVPAAGQKVLAGTTVNFEVR
jgi:beta-lactam-binding protein with PASTA domain